MCSCDEVVRDANKPYFDGVTTPPWHLLRVCRAWDRFLRSYPDLWTFIIVELKANKNITEHPAQLSRLQDHITYSRNQPLKVAIHAEPEILPATGDLFQILQPSLSRWQEVLIYAPHTFIRHLFGGSANLPSLETLHMEITEHQTVNLGPTFLSVPLLTHLYSRPDSVALFELRQNLIVFYQAAAMESSVDQLYWGGVYQEDILYVLSNFSNLTVLRLRASSFGINPLLPPFHSSTVVELQCDFHMFRYLHCPNVIHLDIAPDLTDFTIIKAPRLLRFLRRNGQQVRYLTIRDPRFKIPMPVVLAALPLVEHVALLPSLRLTCDPDTMGVHPSFLALPEHIQDRVAAITFTFDVRSLDPGGNAYILEEDDYLPFPESENELDDIITAIS